MHRHSRTRWVQLTGDMRFLCFVRDEFSSVPIAQCNKPNVFYGFCEPTLAIRFVVYMFDWALCQYLSKLNVGNLANNYYLILNMRVSVRFIFFPVRSFLFRFYQLFRLKFTSNYHSEQWIAHTHWFPHHEESTVTERTWSIPNALFCLKRYNILF